MCGGAGEAAVASMQMRDVKLRRRDPRAAVIALMRAADVARREMIRVLGPYAVTLQQANALIILRLAGPEGLPTLGVAERLIEQTPAITQLMNALVAKKYVRRKQSRTDRRQYLCCLTDTGVRLIDELLPLIRASHARILMRVPDEAVGQLVESLTLIAGDSSPLDESVGPERKSRRVVGSRRRL